VSDDTFSWIDRKNGQKMTVSKLRSLVAIYRGVLEGRHTGPRMRSEVNAAIRAALHKAGEMWIRVFLPKRFDPAYARGTLGYRANAKYEQEKVDMVQSGTLYDFAHERGITETSERKVLVMAPQPTPFVLSGESKSGVLNGARVEARVTASRFVLKVHVNPGRISFTRQYENFMRIPGHEHQRVIAEFEREMRRLTGHKEIVTIREDAPERKVADG
jgi:hypothetical protein